MALGHDALDTAVREIPECLDELIRGVNRQLRQVVEQIHLEFDQIRIEHRKSRPQMTHWTNRERSLTGVRRVPQRIEGVAADLDAGLLCLDSALSAHSCSIPTCLLISRLGTVRRGRVMRDERARKKRGPRRKQKTWASESS